MLGIGTLVRVSKEVEPGQPVVGGQIKRAFDIVTTSLILLGLAPLFFFLAAFVKLTAPGPIIYRHRRVGRKGQCFTCFKFRTMFVNSESRLQLLLEAIRLCERSGRSKQKAKERSSRYPLRLNLEEIER